MSGNVWQLATDWGLGVGAEPLEDPDGTYHAGRLNDALRLDDGTLLVASDTSGVWMADDTGNPSAPLSLDFVQPNLRCLELGIRSPQHVYAGGESLWETDIQASPMDVRNWRQIPVESVGGTALNPGVIHDIAVTVNGLIVIAADAGVYWASIPTAASPTYIFKRAVDAAGINPGRYSAVAASASSDIPVAAGAEGDGTSAHSGLFTGKFAGGDLTFSAATIRPNTGSSAIVPSKMLRTSIASCRGDRTKMYAVAGGQNDGMYCVLSSVDSGGAWDLVSSSVPGHSERLFGDTIDLAGGSQGYSNCIAVSDIAPTPSNPLKVAIGWKNGYFTSRDNGSSWVMIPATDRGLHIFIQGLTFDRGDPDQAKLYVCSDGGLAITRSLGGSHSSISNRHLPNLQLYRGALSGRIGGLVVASLQGNGNQACVLHPTTQPWKEVDDGIGRAVAFLRDDQLLSYTDETVAPLGIHEHRWDTNRGRFRSALGVIPLAGATGGSGLTLTANLVTVGRPWWGAVDQVWPIEVVQRATWRNKSNEALVAVAGSGNSVFGLFKGRTDRDLRWDLLGSFTALTGETIFSVASVDGSFVFAGTNQGRIFKLSAGNPWTVAAMTVNGLTTTTEIQQMSVQSSVLAFAIASGSKVMKLVTSSWDPVSSPSTFLGLAVEDYKAIETDWTWTSISQTKSIFIASDTNVYTSSDNCTSWSTLNTGLPKTPHGVDLRFALEDSGATFLYLATYGWSIFRLLLNATPMPSRTVILDPGSSTILKESTLGDDRDEAAISRRTKQVNVLSPLAEMDIIHGAFGNLTLTMSVHIQYILDESVRITYHVHLNNSDNGNTGDTTGVFVLQPFEFHTESATVGVVGDSGSVTFTMTNE